MNNNLTTYSLGGILLGFALLFAQSSLGLGSIIRIEFAGEVSFLEAGLETDFTVGDSVHGHYSYDNSNPVNALSGDEIARYHVLTSFEVTIGAYIYSSAREGYIQVRDRLPDSPWPTEERYSVVERVFQAQNGGRSGLQLATLFTDSIFGRDELDGIGLPDYVPFEPSDYSGRLYFGPSQSDTLQMNVEIDSIGEATPFAPEVEIASFYESDPGEAVVVDATPVSGYPTDFTYQWYFNGAAIEASSGGTASSFAINGLPESEGTWRVVVTNIAGSDEATFEYRVFVDTDGDGLSDARETLVAGTDPGKWDTDGDGLGDYAEHEVHGTNPLLADSDGDGFLDKFELEAGYDPNSDLSVPDAQVDIRTAIEVSFNGELGATYAIEFSENSKDWTVVEDNIIGEGKAVERLYSRKDYPQGFFRVERLDD